MTRVGGISLVVPATASARMSAGRRHWPRSASVVTIRACCPAGNAAAKKKVSYRRPCPGGVNQFAHGRSRSVRMVRPARASTPARLARRSMMAARTSSPSTSGDPPSRLASSTPVSSNSSRTAATTRAGSASSPRASLHHCRSGPAQPMLSSRSPGSTPPPGKTVIPAAKAIADTRRSTNVSRPSTPSRTSITVAAGRIASVSVTMPT